MNSRSLDATDRALVIATQAGLPLTAKPYDAIASEVGIPCKEVLARLDWMLECGIIRRIGVVPNHYALGLTHNAMTVWDVADGELARLGPSIGALPFVTHCYRRPRQLPAWPYNLFAMVHGHSEAEVGEKAAEIATILGDHCRARDVLVSTRILKKTGLRISA